MRSRALPERALTAALFALLAANTVYFIGWGTPSKAIDSIAWLILLSLFVAETSFPNAFASPRACFTLRISRLVAGAGVFAATIGYVFEDNALDAINCVLWIAVVVLLEMQLRFPSLVERSRRVFAFAIWSVYAGLGMLVLLWTMQGMWFDAYDAVIWLIAFVALELKVNQTG